MKFDRIVAALCEQRSYLPGDAEWSAAPADECPLSVSTKDMSTPSTTCNKCRRTWARKKTAESSLPADSSAEVDRYRVDWQIRADSSLPGDENQLSEGTMSNERELAAAVLVATKSFFSFDKAMYRWDPKHHRRPLGPGWRSSPSGWTKHPPGAKSGPKPKGEAKGPIGYG